MNDAVTRRAYVKASRRVTASLLSPRREVSGRPSCDPRGRPVSARSSLAVDRSSLADRSAVADRSAEAVRCVSADHAAEAAHSESEAARTSEVSPVHYAAPDVSKAGHNAVLELVRSEFRRFDGSEAQRQVFPAFALEPDVSADFRHCPVLSPDVRLPRSCAAHFPPDSQYVSRPGSYLSAAAACRRRSGTSAAPDRAAYQASELLLRFAHRYQSL